MKEIKDAQRKWLEAKAKAARLRESEGNADLAAKLNACQMFKGDESLEGLVDLMFSPQGAEFLTKFGFPDLRTFRKFKKYHPERLGVYIDCGEIVLNDESRVFLVGNTAAKLNYSKTQGNRVVMMHGATATIIAEGYSVVKVENDGSSKMSLIKKDSARVLA